VVLGIGFGAKRLLKTDLDFFLSGRSLPAWITGLAFIAANLGALEVLGMAANGAQYGVATVHFYWIGAIPAMVFLGIVMMPFYYGSKVRSVPEWLRRRYNRPTHLFNALSFALATVLISGVNLFALGLVLSLMLGWSISTAIVIAAFIVLAYITLGGLTSAIYNEVLQFFIIVAALVPLRRSRSSTWGASAAWSVRSGRATWASLGCTPGRASGSAATTRSGPTGSPRCSALASCSPSATGPPTSPRYSARCRPTRCRPRGAHR
jgi:Na+(H+)/acetate symporter ActP